MLLSAAVELAIDQSNPLYTSKFRTEVKTQVHDDDCKCDLFSKYTGVAIVVTQRPVALEAITSLMYV